MVRLGEARRQSGMPRAPAVRMSEQSEELKLRSMRHGVAVLRTIDGWPRRPGYSVVGYQLAKAATSVGANYRAACIGRSRAEFMAKMQTVTEECDETVYWLEVMALFDPARATELKDLTDESIALRKIFGKTLGTARSNDLATTGGKRAFSKDIGS